MIWLYSALGLGGLAMLVYIVRSIKAWGNSELKQEQAENETKAHETRNKVEDAIARDSALDKRLRLKRWSLRRVETDKTD